MRLAQGSSTPLSLAVIGLGKLGSPMAAVFAEKGFDVVGVDLNPGVVAAINAGRAPVAETGLNDLMARAHSRLRATTDCAAAISATEVSFVAVPTPSGADHVFSNAHVIDAVTRIGQALRNGTTYHLVVVTSTVMPGSMDGVIRQALETASGRHLGETLGLCYSPEFIALGSVITDLQGPDLLLVGESDARAGEMLSQIYARVVVRQPEVHRMNFINAEITKIVVNTFVTTKITYANVIADLCDRLPGADCEAVTRAVGADSRIGRKYLRGAVGYGGPCFPRDNKAFVALGRQLGVRCDLPVATDDTNDYQTERLAQIVDLHLKPGGRVTVLGMSYKPRTGVIDASPGVDLARCLARRGYKVTISDPEAANDAAAVLGPVATVQANPHEAIADADAVVIATPWLEFAGLNWNRPLVLIDPWRMIDMTRVGSEVTLVVPGKGARCAVPQVVIAT